MSEMTAMRMVRAATGIATLLLVTGLGLLAARFLWRTEVPDDLALPHLDPSSRFAAPLLHRTARHDAFLRVDYLAALVAQLAGLGLIAALAPRIDRRLRGNALLRGLQLAALAGLTAWLFRLPFGAAGQWWERRYGLSRLGWGGWLYRRLPGPVEIGVLLALVALGMGLARLLGRRWWLAAAPLATALVTVAVLVQPLGGGLKPLRDRGLARAIDRVARADGLGHVTLGVQKVGHETRRANAEAVGIGPTRRIVFWDTIVDGRFDEGELRFVGAHEVAHLARRHVWRGLGWFALFALPAAWLLARAAERRGGLARPAAVPVVLAVAASLQLVSLPVVGAISRRYEAEADWLALRATHDPRSATGLLQRFAAVNLEQPRPPGWAHVLLADHPSLVQRIAMAEAWRRSHR